MRTTGKVFLLIMAFILLFPGSGFATHDDPLDRHYDLAAYDSNIANNAYGTRGSNYVMSNPTIVRQHVSSMYVYDPNGPYLYMAEVGWFANTWQSGSRPRFFTAWVIKDKYYEYLWEYPTPGTNHSYAIGYRSDGTGWHYWIDGVEKASGLLGFAKGYTLTSSERDQLGDTNYSHFWGMQKKNSSGNWYNWSTQSMYRDYDDYYYIHWPPASTTEMYMKLP